MIRPQRTAGRQRRGGMTMFFVAFMFPFLLGALSLVSDISRLIVDNRAVNDVASAMSLAAAHAITEAGIIDESLAREEAAKTLAEATRVGMLPASVDVYATVVEVGPQSVTVRLSFRVGGLALVGFFTGSGGQDATSVATAALCDPADSDTPCAYPV